MLTYVSAQAPTTERPFLSDDHAPTSDQDTLFENLAAELTGVAYPLVLRHGLRGSSIEAELGLWRALTETVRKWAREWPPPRSADEFAAWREGLLVDLTEDALDVAEKHGINTPLPDVELAFYRAFRPVVRRVAQETLGRPLSRVRFS
jgi:hypothetical protein